MIYLPPLTPLAALTKCMAAPPNYAIMEGGEGEWTYILSGAPSVYPIAKHRDSINSWVPDGRLFDPITATNKWEPV